MLHLTKFDSKGSRAAFQFFFSLKHRIKGKICWRDKIKFSRQFSSKRQLTWKWRISWRAENSSTEISTIFFWVRIDRNRIWALDCRPRCDVTGDKLSSDQGQILSGCVFGFVSYRCYCLCQGIVLSLQCWLKVIAVKFLRLGWSRERKQFPQSNVLNMVMKLRGPNAISHDGSQLF